MRRQLPQGIIYWCHVTLTVTDLSKSGEIYVAVTLVQRLDLEFMATSLRRSLTLWARWVKAQVCLHVNRSCKYRSADRVRPVAKPLTAQRLRDLQEATTDDSVSFLCRSWTCSRYISLATCTLSNFISSSISHRSRSLNTNRKNIITAPQSTVNWEVFPHKNVCVCQITGQS